MNDLLTDSFVSNGKERPTKEPDIEMGTRFARSNSDLGLEAFNKQIQEGEKQVDKLSELLTKLKDANEESKSVTKASSMKIIRKRMQKDVDEVGKIARNVKSKLEAINKDNLANRQKPGCGKGTGVDRSRTNMSNALTRKFRDLMIEFQTLRQKIDDEYRQVVERRVITVTGTRPDEDTINHLIETGNSEQIFQKAILETGRGQVQNTLEEIQERHDAVKEIEKKLLDLHQIYLDMAVLVEAQGDLLDNIETQVMSAVDSSRYSSWCHPTLAKVALQSFAALFINNRKPNKFHTKRKNLRYTLVVNAVDHVHMGTDALQTAKSLQKKSRKCMMIAIILLLLIAIIIVLSVLKPWKK